MRSRFFENGFIKAANLTVIKLLIKGLAQNETMYLARMECCNSIVKLNHIQIMARIQKKNITCRNCIKTKYYQQKENVFNANLTVLNQLHLARAKADTRYSVSMNCCGNVVELTHQEIDWRIDKGSMACRACRAKGGKNSKGTYVAPFNQPPEETWIQSTQPKPPSVPTGHVLWSDRMRMNF